MGRARLALSFGSGCPGRVVPGVPRLRSPRAPEAGCWLCTHVGRAFVGLGCPGPMGGCNHVYPIPCTPNGGRSPHRCCYFCIFVLSIMSMFAPSYFIFKTNAERTTNIASQYRLAQMKVCELICRISRLYDAHKNFKKYSIANVYWIYLISFSMLICFPYCHW